MKNDDSIRARVFQAVQHLASSVDPLEVRAIDAYRHQIAPILREDFRQVGTVEQYDRIQAVLERCEDQVSRAEAAEIADAILALDAAHRPPFAAG